MLKRYSFFANGEKAEGLTWLSSPPPPLPSPPPTKHFPRGKKLKLTFPALALCQSVSTDLGFAVHLVKSQKK